jgi:hypothetical protein
MRSLALVLVFVVNTCFAQTPAKDTSGAWISSKVDWQLDAFHKEKKWAQTKVLYFFEDGRFGIVVGSISQTGNEMEISYGDAQTVYFGSWKQKAGMITVKYRLLYRDVPQRDAQRGRAQQEQVAVHGNGELIFQGLTFSKEPRLDSSASSTITEKLPSARTGDQK